MVDTSILDSIVIAFALKKHWWNLDDNATHRHQAFFIRRRAQYLGEQDEQWLKGPHYQALIDRLEAEFIEVETYITSKIGTSAVRGSLYGGSGDTIPSHLDLAEVAKRIARSADSITVAEALAAEMTTPLYEQVRDFLEWRKKRVLSIIWRATALHAELWNEKKVELRIVAMDEILDRRLRTVERMFFDVSSAGTNPGLGSWKTTKRGKHWDLVIENIDKEWFDGTFGLFEYPKVPASAIAFIPSNKPIKQTISDFLGGSYDSTTRFAIGAIGRPPRADWYYNAQEDELEWNDVPPGVRLPQEMEGWWSSGGVKEYALVVKKDSGKPPAEVLAILFQRQPSDWWDRIWLYDDHVMSALHLEALRFALLRRYGDDSIFNNLVKTYDLALNDHFDSRPKEDVRFGFSEPEEWVMESDLLRSNSDYFENLFLPSNDVQIDDLQVGDHLLFWNNFLYSVIRTGTPHLTHVLVTDVDSNPSNGGINLRRLKLQAFKTKELTCPAYQLRMRREIQHVWEKLQTFVITEVANNSDEEKWSRESSIYSLNWDTWHTTHRDWNWNLGEAADIDFIIWQWLPYPDDFIFRYQKDPDKYIPAAWWIRINLERWGRAIGVTSLESPQAAEQAVLALPKSLAWTSKNELVTADMKKRNGTLKRISIGKDFQKPPWAKEMDDSEENIPRNHSFSIFFPIFEPGMQGGWSTYLEKRAIDSSHRGYPMRLVKTDGDIVPRFFNKFKPTKSFRIIRPRISK